MRIRRAVKRVVDGFGDFHYDLETMDTASERPNRSERPRRAEGSKAPVEGFKVPAEGSKASAEGAEAPAVPAAPAARADGSPRNDSQGPRHTIEVPRSSSAEEARTRLLDAAQAWISDCVTRYADAPATNVHDQGTYTVSWLPVLATRPDERVLTFLRRTRDRIHRHFAETDQWHHGYWRMHEVHHGTEHFELFLYSLYQLDRTDEATIGPFLDMAEHLGNWSADVPPWFDWDRGLYRSMYFGTDGVDERPGADINVGDFFRCINLALAAYEMNGDDRYLSVARRHGERWAAAVAEEPAGALPAGLGPAGTLYSFRDKGAETYRSFVGEAPALGHAAANAENMLASGALQSFLGLYRHTGEASFAEAARDLVAVLAAELESPTGAAAADALLRYRRATGDGQFDRRLLEAVAPEDARRVQRLGIDPEVSREVRRDGRPQPGKTPGLVGVRSDMPNWYEDGAPRRHNPVTLAAAAAIAEREDWRTLALDLGYAYFELARRSYPDGRDHGCSSRSVSAVARGHGRDNNVGVLTGLL